MTKELKERNQRISTELIRMLDSLQNISSKDVSGNLSNLNNILAEAVTVRIEKEQLHNMTVQAIAFANDINKTLDDYTTAVKGGNANVSEHANMKMGNMSSSTSMDRNSFMNVNMTNNANNEEIIKNLSAYQRSSALTDIATDRFNRELKGKSNLTSAMEQAVKGLGQLKLAIKGMASIDAVMGIVMARYSQICKQHLIYNSHRYENITMAICP